MWVDRGPGFLGKRVLSVLLHDEQLQAESARGSLLLCLDLLVAGLCPHSVGVGVGGRVQFPEEFM